MKGYYIELRRVDRPAAPVASAGLASNATPERRRRMAQRLLERSPEAQYTVIEYEADWTDCNSPEFVEIERYSASEL